jgi:cystathionine beta-lyase/cystathionine gamma-synthase
VYRLIEELIRPRSIEVVYLDMTDLSSWELPAQVMFVETIAATSFPAADIATLSRMKKKDSVLIVDNTLATPIYCRPLALGADLVCHSATKYLGGHDDVLAGVLCGSRKLVGRAQAWQSLMGAVLDPFGAFLVHRGLKTLPLRIARQSENALVLAKFLESHPRVSQVYYPGLESYPQRELAATQLTGYGGVLSFELSDPTQGEHFVDRLRLVVKASSLGGLNTKIHHPDERYTAEHLINTHRRQTLLRVSVGCEDSDDIVTDFENALNG